MADPHNHPSPSFNAKTPISKVFRAADIVAEPARKRTPLRLPRNDDVTIISSYKIVNEVLVA